MDSHEVLIHYAANNMVSEDVRWMKIARGIVSFKPARRLRLSDPIISANELEETSPSNSTHTYGSTQHIDTHLRSDRISRSPQAAVEISDVVSPLLAKDGRKRRASNSFEKRPVNTSKRKKGTSFARTKKGLNPAFKNPIAGYMKSGKPFSSQETPKPRTACANVLVPVTESPKYFQSRCKQSYLGSSPGKSKVQNHNTIVYIDETSFTDDSASPVGRSRPTLPGESGSVSGNDSFEILDYPGNQEQFYARDHDLTQSMTHASAHPERISCEEFDVGEMVTGTVDQSGTQEPKTSTDRTTTATPSDIEFCADISSPLAQKGREDHGSVIDLTSSPEEHLPLVTRRDVLGSTGPSNVQEQDFKEKYRMNFEPGSPDISDLPRRYMCHANYTMKSRPFESFLPKYLMDLADRFELPNHFRPVVAPKCIRNNERGYWNLRVSLTNITEVARARRAPLTSSQWSDKRFMMRQEGLVPTSASVKEGNNSLKQLMYPDISPDTYIPWTITEFRTFWSYLGEVIRKGRAGYDVHATLKCHEAIAEDQRIVVKLYGYSEALSHLWLLLYGVSSTLTANMPLQWYLPGSGPLITMSGQLWRGGTLGRWVPKESGINGSWGIEANWEGLGSAAVDTKLRGNSILSSS